MKRTIAISSYAAWCSLGFVRGIKSYVPEKDQPYLYSNSFVYGLGGMCIYANPCFIPVLCYKEIYRLEVDARNLENEKKSRAYDDIL